MNISQHCFVPTSFQKGKYYNDSGSLAIWASTNSTVLSPCVDVNTLMCCIGQGQGESGGAFRLFFSGSGETSLVYKSPSFQYAQISEPVVYTFAGNGAQEFSMSISGFLPAFVGLNVGFLLLRQPN